MSEVFEFATCRDCPRPTWGNDVSCVGLVQVGQRVCFHLVEDGHRHGGCVILVTVVEGDRLDVGDLEVGLGLPEYKTAPRPILPQDRLGDGGSGDRLVGFNEVACCPQIPLVFSDESHRTLAFAV